MLKELTGKWSQYMDEGLLIKALTSIDDDLENICPGQEDVFRAFNELEPENTRAILIGQDPYPQKGVATGLLFANRPLQSPLSPSLQIVKECILHPEKPSYKASDEARFDPTMMHWIKQGVLLINSSLTVKTGCPGSHFEYWKPFISDFLRKLSRDRYDLPYILFGNQAASLMTCIENAGCIIKCKHPAMYARQGVKMSEDPFTKLNEFFKEFNMKQIEWLIPEETEDDDLPF